MAEGIRRDERRLNFGQLVRLDGFYDRKKDERGDSFMETLSQGKLRSRDLNNWKLKKKKTMRSPCYYHSICGPSRANGESQVSVELRW
jgi:hypothetical protein